MEDLNYTTIIEDSLKLLDAIDTKENKEVAITSQDMLRTTLMTFIGSQLQSIKKQDNLKAIVEAELIRKISLHDMTTDELLDLYQKMSQAKTFNITALLDIFKPTNASPNSIITPPIDKGESEDITKTLTPQQRNALDKLTQLLEKVDSKSKVVDAEKVED